VFKEREDLVAFIRAHVPKLENGSVLVVTSKIVALAEGRTAKVGDKQRLVKKESSWQLQAKYGKITLKDGVLMWNAGIDSSNAFGGIVLLPKDSFKTAAALRRKLLRFYKIKRLGVVVTDSRIMPLRAGVVGIALGYAGFKGLRDYRGEKDLSGVSFFVTRTDVADSLATAAVLEMGEGDERQPLAIIEGAPVEFADRINKKELLIAFEDDMYAPLFSKKRKR
jgi:coenzyme F420-0:L-glutamate ligase